jgi:hypothetical protein
MILSVEQVISGLTGLSLRAGFAIILPFFPLTATKSAMKKILFTN